MEKKFLKYMCIFFEKTVENKRSVVESIKKMKKTGKF
jgi:hypothetical protein